MTKIKSFGFTDPKDLREWSTVSYVLFLQSQLLDYAWRYYKRQDDTKSKRRSKEIKKVLKNVFELQTMAVRSLISEDVKTECDRVRVTWISKNKTILDLD